MPPNGVLVASGSVIRIDHAHEPFFWSIRAGSLMASVNHEKMLEDNVDLCYDLRCFSTLREAWLVVRDAGRLSKSPESRAAVEAFAKSEDRKLRRIQSQLQTGRFEFAPAKGVAKRRKGKTPRPIVVAPIENRIVQRAMLDVLQQLTDLAAEFLQVETSFGGVRGYSMGDAVLAAQRAIRKGGIYFCRADIRSFFANIPREQALQRLDPYIPDAEFRNLLRKATETELENADELGELLAIFPGDVGVAQGCSLSSLIGNALLRDFDRELNQREMTCIRYVDDFLLLGRRSQHVRKAFLTAQEMLGRVGLAAYDPWTDAKAVGEGKAEHGYSDQGFEFLGCHVEPELIRPSRKNRQNALTLLKGMLDESRSSWHPRAHRRGELKPLIPTLMKVRNLWLGWTKAFAFCTDKAFFAELANEAEKIVDDYRRSYGRTIRANPASARLLYGVLPPVSLGESAGGDSNRPSSSPRDASG